MATEGAAVVADTLVITSFLASVFHKVSSQTTAPPSSPGSLNWSVNT
jgi:hypothetical protein